MKSAVPALTSSVSILIIVLITYSAFVISTHHYERLTGDATLYLSIAEKYVQGDFSNAINGYWGPLLSWLLIPFLYLGSSHVFAINSLNLLFGMLTIIGIWRLSSRFEISGSVRSIMLLPLVPVLLFVSVIEPMDFLLLCILVFYLDIVFREDYPDRVSHALLGGMLGALAYFSKPFGFPFFISHFLMMNIFHYFIYPMKKHRRRVLRNALAGYVVFALLSGVWIGLISNKYNRITFSNMGKGVLSSLGPGSKHTTMEKGDPIFFEGFFEPPNETAFIIYEDPSYARKKSWNPLESRDMFKHYLANIKENLFQGIRIYDSYSRLSIAILISYILLLLSQSRKSLLLRRDLLFPLSTIILYTGGYLPFHFETRYLWIVNILLLLMGARVLNELFKRDFFRKGIIKNALILFFVLSFIMTPLKTLIDIDRNSLNREMYVLGSKLGRQYDIKGNIASNRRKVLMTAHDSWHKTFRLSYWLQSRYYGNPKENISDEDLENELEKFNIDYYFYWDDAGSVPEFLSQYREMTRGEIPRLRIYSLNEKE